MLNPPAIQLPERNLQERRATLPTTEPLFAPGIWFPQWWPILRARKGDGDTFRWSGSPLGSERESHQNPALRGQLPRSPPSHKHSWNKIHAPTGLHIHVCRWSQPLPQYLIVRPYCPACRHCASLLTAYSFKTEWALVRLGR
jgi:hypothetical protein